MNIINCDSHKSDETSPKKAKKKKLLNSKSLIKKIQDFESVDSSLARYNWQIKEAIREIRSQRKENKDADVSADYAWLKSYLETRNKLINKKIKVKKLMKKLCILYNKDVKMKGSKCQQEV